jgi:hypothetical protein
MKKKTQNKLMFKKMEVMELTSRDLLRIQGGLETTGADLPTHTFSNNGNNGGVINPR